MKMEAVYFSEKSAEFHQTACNYILRDRTPHKCCSDNMKSRIILKHD
jgi:hypothetical protein